MSMLFKPEVSYCPYCGNPLEECYRFSSIGSTAPKICTNKVCVACHPRYILDDMEGFKKSADDIKEQLKYINLRIDSIEEKLNSE